MPEPHDPAPAPGAFDRDAVRAAWDVAADAYDAAQRSGRDWYRIDFFGPAHLAQCGDVAGLHVLDLGCGSGWFARELARRGARVTATDLSPRMIAHARRHEAEAPLGIDYRVGDAQETAGAFPAAAFDLVTSCLALQDMPEPAAALRGAHAVLRPGGRLVASITHPFSDTPFRAWERDAAGAKRWLCVDRYFERGPIAYEWKRWPYPFTTVALHAPLEDWVAWLLDAGFRLRALREPRPTPEAIARRPELADAARVPYYVVLDGVREA